MVLVVVAGAMAWVTSNDISDTSRDSLRSAELALGGAVELAGTTEAIALELQNSIATLSNGMGSAAEAMENSVVLSTNLRTLLDSLSAVVQPVLGSTDELQGDLANAEVSLLEVRGGLLETQTALNDAEPKVAAAVATLQFLPNDLRAAQASIQRAIKQLDRQVILWRLVIAIGVIAVLLLAAALDRMARALRPATQSVRESAAVNQP